MTDDKKLKLTGKHFRALRDYSNGDRELYRDLTPDERELVRYGLLKATAKNEIRTDVILTFKGRSILSQLKEMQRRGNK